MEKSSLEVFPSMGKKKKKGRKKGREREKEMESDKKYPIINSFTLHKVHHLSMPMGIILQ